MKTTLLIFSMFLTNLLFGQKSNNMFEAPVHLKHFCKPVDHLIKTKIVSEYGKYITVFSISDFNSKIEIGFDEQEILGVVKGINDKGDTTILFDSTLHGYNGLYNLSESNNTKSFKTIDLSGKRLIIAFQYGGEEENYAQENGGLPQDYFDWIVIYESFNGKLRKLFEYECA